MKKKIYFLAPKNEWWTYFYYKEISEYLIKSYSDIYDVYFCNSLFDYIKLHFIKTDIIFSIIPFLFKPIWAKKYFFNLHWNYKIERKNKLLWVKLLYLTELNLWFCDKIILTSYYLADKLNFRDKYNFKIIISKLFIWNFNRSKNDFKLDNVKLLTISSANFYEKWIWVYDLAKEIVKLKNLNLTWKIVLPWNIDNKKIIVDKINSLKKGDNLNIEIYDFLPKEELNNLYIESDIFVYSSNLETWWWVIMDASSFWIPIILLNNDLWSYIYPKEFITDNFEQKFLEIINNYDFYSDLSYNFSLNYKKEDIINDLLNKIKE
jgi:hypothetical protein